MEINEVLTVVSALDSETRLRYVNLLGEEPMSTRELQERYRSRYDESIRRESVHRGIETLREAGILTRQYDENKNHFTYRIAARDVIFDLHALSIQVE